MALVTLTLTSNEFRFIFSHQFMVIMSGTHVFFLPLKSIYIDRRHIFDFMFCFNVDYKPLYVIKMCYCKETKYILKFIKQKDYRKQQQRYSAAVNTRYY